MSTAVVAVGTLISGPPSADARTVIRIAPDGAKTIIVEDQRGRTTIVCTRDKRVEKIEGALQLVEAERLCARY